MKLILLVTAAILIGAQVFGQTVIINGFRYAPPAGGLTFVSESETLWNSTTAPKTTASTPVQVGDILIAYAVKEGAAGTWTTPVNTGTALTWTLEENVDVS